MSHDRTHRRGDESGRRNFYLYWIGDAVSDALANISALAIPLAAITLLDASALQVGFLASVNLLPLLLVTPFAGVVVDRFRRRPLLAGTNAVRAIALASIPLLGWLAGFSFGVLIAIAFLLGALAALFNIASLAFIPALVSRERLVWANGLLSASGSLAESVGPALAGWLIVWLSAPGALLLDALGMAFAAILILAIQINEPVPTRLAKGRGFAGVLSDIWLGMRKTVTDPVLGTLAAFSGWSNFFYQVLMTNFLLLTATTLQFDAGLIGALLAPMGGGAAIGAFVASRVGDRVALGKSLGLGLVVSAIGPVVMIGYAGDGLGPQVLMGIGFALYGLGITYFNVYSVSLRQLTAAPSVIGMVSASYRVIAHGSLPLGAAFGGLLGHALGSVAAIWISGAAMMFAAALYWWTPPGHLKEMPAKASVF